MLLLTLKKKTHTEAKCKPLQITFKMDVECNAKEYNSALYVAGILSFEAECPIENWLYNSVDNLKGSTIELPKNRMDISEVMMQKKGLYYILFWCKG